MDKDAQNSARREQSFAAPSDGADAPTEGALRIGVVSDTHGYLDPDIMDLFEGVDLIVHAGDVAGVRLAVGHKRKRLVKRLVGGTGGEFDLVVFGHDHVPSASWVGGTAWLNPGSASAPYEEDELPTVAIVERMPTGLGVRFIPLRRRKPQVPSPPAKHSRSKAGGS